MALDRQSIEKKDFPIARRGYDPEAVDAHLAELAGEIEVLKRQAAAQTSSATAPVGAASLAMAASEQVRTIVEAAENSASQIEAAARGEAARIRGDADADADTTRADAVERSRAHVAHVGEATSVMLQRVDAMEGELGALMESLRTGANRLTADLTLLQGNMGDLYSATSVPVPTAPEPAAHEPEPEYESFTAEAPLEEELTEAVYVALDEEAPAEPAPADAMPVPPPEMPAPPPPPVSPSARTAGDVEGARLIALNMALNGQSREETDRYLSDNFDLDDRAALLDEVFATVDG